MKKNGQYVGVDEKFIPEEEKFVNNNLNDEIKGDMHDMYKGAKEYVSDKDNQEKMKNVGRKGLKIAKGIGIGYLAFAGIVIVMAILIFGLVFTQFFKTGKQSEQIKDSATNIINNRIDKINEQQDKMDVNDFNFGIESYNGTQYGSTVTSILDKVVTKIKKNSNHSITVTYNSTTTSKTDEIILLKKQFDLTTKYEVSMDYDSNGFINKITISNY